MSDKCDGLQQIIDMADAPEETQVATSACAWSVSGSTGSN